MDASVVTRCRTTAPSSRSPRSRFPDRARSSTRPIRPCWSPRAAPTGTSRRSMRMAASSSPPTIPAPPGRSRCATRPPVRRSRRSRRRRASSATTPICRRTARSSRTSRPRTMASTKFPVIMPDNGSVVVRRSTTRPTPSARSRRSSPTTRTARAACRASTRRSRPTGNGCWSRASTRARTTTRRTARSGCTRTPRRSRGWSRPMARSRRSAPRREQHRRARRFVGALGAVQRDRHDRRAALLHHVHVGPPVRRPHPASRLAADLDGTVLSGEGHGRRRSERRGVPRAVPGRRHNHIAQWSQQVVVID